jgi:putative ABC transport system permease protein
VRIGVRKVFGAGLTNIVSVIGTDFLYVVLVASGIAAVLAWYFMSRWLYGFSYHHGMSLLPFVAGIMTAVITAFLAIVHAWKASKMDPAISIKYE